MIDHRIGNVMKFTLSNGENASLRFTSALTSDMLLGFAVVLQSNISYSLNKRKEQRTRGFKNLACGVNDQAKILTVIRKKIDTISSPVGSEEFNKEYLIKAQTVLSDFVKT